MIECSCLYTCHTGMQWEQMHSSTHLLHWHDTEMNWQPQAPDTLPWERTWKGCWMWPGTGVDTLEKRKISCPCWNSNPGSSSW